MGAIKSLVNWWQAIVSKDDLEPWNGLKTPEEVKEAARESRKTRAALDAWSLATFSFLGEEVADQISRRIRRAARNEAGEMLDVVSALRDGLVSDFFRGKRTAFAFLFDARYTEDAEVILAKVCSAYGIKDRFLYNEVIQGADPSKVLTEFKEWLRERSFDVVIFDTGGDEYCGFLVPLAACDNALLRMRTMEIRATNVPSEA